LQPFLSPPPAASATPRAGEEAPRRAGAGAALQLGAPHTPAPGSDAHARETRGLSRAGRQAPRADLGHAEHRSPRPEGAHPASIPPSAELHRASPRGSQRSLVSSDADGLAPGARTHGLQDVASWGQASWRAGESQASWRAESPRERQGERVLRAAGFAAGLGGGAEPQYRTLHRAMTPSGARPHEGGPRRNVPLVLAPASGPPAHLHGTGGEAREWGGAREERPRAPLTAGPVGEGGLAREAPAAGGAAPPSRFLAFDAYVAEARLNADSSSASSSPRDEPPRGYRPQIVLM